MSLGILLRKYCHLFYTFLNRYFLYHDSTYFGQCNFDQLVIDIIYVIYNKMSIFQPFRMQIVSKSSRNHSNLYDSEWRISFLSDMRCVIRPQNYSIRKPMNFAIFLKRFSKILTQEYLRMKYFKLKIRRKVTGSIQRCCEQMFAKYVRYVIVQKFSCSLFNE